MSGKHIPRCILQPRTHLHKKVVTLRTMQDWLGAQCAGTLVNSRKGPNSCLLSTHGLRHRIFISSIRTIWTNRVSTTSAQSYYRNLHANVGGLCWNLMRDSRRLVWIRLQRHLWSSGNRPMRVPLHIRRLGSILRRSVRLETPRSSTKTPNSSKGIHHVERAVATHEACHKRLNKSIYKDICKSISNITLC